MEALIGTEGTTMRFLGAILALGLASAAPAASDGAPSVRGLYVEARSCDVWTGPCFSNSEFNVVGNLAVVGWTVTEGVWDGVRLDGRSVVAVIEAEGTLMTTVEGRTRAGLYVDAGATSEQARALEAMARALAPGHLGRIVRVERRPISIRVEGAEATLSVGRDEAVVRTGPLGHCDAVCGNEQQAYAPIGAGARVLCAKALEHAYRGTVIEDRSWSYPNRRSAMVGSFER